MNILVVNDDGIQSVGLRALVKALSDVADIYVCAPNGQRSAKSQAISVRADVTVEAAEVPFAKKAYAVDGTPADCTKLGLQFGRESGTLIDMVFSGINHGSNLGLDTVYSGTVGAAMEAAMDGVHAVAVSVDSHEPVHFDAACRLAVQSIDFAYGKFSTDSVININTPDLPADEIKGIRFTTLGPRYYDDCFRSRDGKVFRLEGDPPESFALSNDIDVQASMNGYATITPLQFNYTDYRNLEKIREWDLQI